MTKLGHRTGYWTFLLCFISLILEVAAGPTIRHNLPEPTPTTNELVKRVNVDLAALWSSIPQTQLVPVDGQEPYTLDPTVPKLISTKQYYGCTVVIIVDGKNVLMGHYLEAKGRIEMNDETLGSAQKTQQHIIDRIEELQAWVDESEHRHAWIIAPEAYRFGAGTKLLTTHLSKKEEDGGLGIPACDVIYRPYTKPGTMTSDFPGQPKGKAVVRWTPRPNGAGATLDVFIHDNTAVFSQNYDAHGNPNRKRDADSCQTPDDGGGGGGGGGGIGGLFGMIPHLTLGAKPSPTPSCTYMGPMPPEKPDGSCECDGKDGYPLTTLKENVAPESSCAWSTLPTGGPTTAKNPLGPATTDKKRCQVCTRYAYNEDDCTPIPNCVKQVAQASVQVGTSPAHVGTLTDSALSTSISSALEKLCPSPTLPSVTACKTDSVFVENIEYRDEKSNEENKNGRLEVKVSASSYNDTTIRKAMIDAAALTAMQSATGSNCYDDDKVVSRPGKLRRGLNALATAYNSLAPSNLPRAFTPEALPETRHWCSASSFAGVQYYGEFARVSKDIGSATMYLDAGWMFEVAKDSKFDCEFLGSLIDAMVVVAPQFAVADLSLGEAIAVTCDMGQQIGGHKKRKLLTLPFYS